ncbi:MAG: ankyrin repeat domain-containing protein [Chloroflexi bacterium]|nr:ankyrin repeat domain-containing protein [Chloroflexota bacterium]
MSAREELRRVILADQLEELEELLAADPALAAAEGDDSPVLLALARGRHEALAALLETNPPLTLFEAVALGDDVAVQAQLRRDKTQMEARTPDGLTSLLLAAHFGQGSIANGLLQWGANARAVTQGEHERNALHLATWGGHRTMAALLLEHGLPIDEPQDGGLTPLHIAAQRGDFALASLLVLNGARGDLESDDGKTAADLAYEFAHDALAEYLRMHAS